MNIEEILHNELTEDQYNNTSVNFYRSIDFKN